MPIKENKTIYQRTIPVELLEVWNKYRRQGDGGDISEALGYSRPVIDRALKHGYVKTKGLTDKISEFFTDRLKKEREQAGAMTELLNHSTN
jgi:hypothetical protein